MELDRKNVVRTAIENTLSLRIEENMTLKCKLSRLLKESEETEDYETIVNESVIWITNEWEDQAKRNKLFLSVSIEVCVSNNGLSLNDNISSLARDSKLVFRTEEELQQFMSDVGSYLPEKAKCVCSLGEKKVTKSYHMCDETFYENDWVTCRFASFSIDAMDLIM